MPISVPNPYTGKDDETCSVSFAAQQKLNETGVSGQQTESEYNKSKILGEIGVMKAKLDGGQIPDGTKVLTYHTKEGLRGYYFVKGGKLKDRLYDKDGKVISKESFTSFSNGEYMVNLGKYNVAIPQSVAPKPKPEGVPLTKAEAQLIDDGEGAFSSDPDKVLAVNAAGDFITFDDKSDKFLLHTKAEDGYGYVVSDQKQLIQSYTNNSQWFKPDDKATTPNATPKVTTPTTKVSAPVASPTPAPAVNPASGSVGSMSNEDVAAMFVKIKDDLVKELGINIKGANSDLDAVVHKSIGGKTGYTQAEVKAKIDAYKADGNKLSALKKKVMAGTKKVPDGKPQQTKAATPSTPITVPGKHPQTDPKPNGVPTVATPAVAKEAKEEVKAEVKADPAKHYSDEDVAAAYIIAKDKIVAQSGGAYTLYSKNDQMEADIYAEILSKTGVYSLQAKAMIANYLASGKKLSQLKKSLAKQGAFTPQADTLKKSSGDKSQADKAKDVDAKADAGYTPTSTPAAGTPPTDTGKPQPKRVEKEDAKAGEIDHISQSDQLAIYQAYKAKGHLAYLSSGPGANYDAMAALQVQYKASGADYTLLQLMRVIDAQGAKKFNAENTKLLEKQVATWLTTPDGTNHIKSAEQKLIKLAEDAKKAKEIAEAAKKLEANQPPLPADSASFYDLSLAEAKELDREWQRIKPRTAAEVDGLRHYTGSAYHTMNGYLRGLQSSIDDRNKKAIKDAKNGMRPTTKPLLLRRGTGRKQFGLEDINSIWGLTGKTVTDGGFLSTSAGGQAAFGGKILMEVEAPVGTPMAYVDPFSKHPGENEMLLQAGLFYKVLNVRKAGHQFVVRLRVVNEDGK
jgi:ADP-ribosyltransferase exoenzyme